MKRGKSGIFTLSSTSIIICECLITIVVLFLDTFLVSKILKLTPGNYTGVAYFNCIYYLSIAFAFLVFTPLMKKIKKRAFVNIGAFLMGGVFIFVYLLGDALIDWICVLGIVSGLSYGIFDAGFINLMTDSVSSKNQTIYFSIKNIIIFMCKTVFPLVLGSIIDLGSFPLMCVILAVVCGLIFVFSFLVKEKPGPVKTFNLVNFVKIVKEGGEETKPLKTLYVSAFFRGLCFDLIGTALTVLVFLQCGGSDFKIGLIQTIFTATQLISMFVFMKFYHKHKAKIFIFGSLSVILCAIIPVLVSQNNITILLLYGVYTFFRLFITTITDMRRTSIIRMLSMHSHSLEHNTIYALIQGITRGLIYLSFLLFLVLPEWIMLDIIIGVVAIGYIGYSISLYILEKQLIQQDIRWKAEHPEVVNSIQNLIPVVSQAIKDRKQQTLQKKEAQKN